MLIDCCKVTKFYHWLLLSLRSPLFVFFFLLVLGAVTVSCGSWQIASSQYQISYSVQLATSHLILLAYIKRVASE
jgi:uncharacterized membrane protein